jgi:putative hydrolases of HD superfamily
VGPATAALLAAAHGAGPVDDLGHRLAFLVELDRLKSVVRRNRLADDSRSENTAEHSWHLALFALVLAPYAEPPVDVGRVVTMLLVHDIVEIDAGDTFIHDEAAMAGKAEREQLAARRLFGLLPAADAERYEALWQEFEAGTTADARFAYAMDRLQPVLLNALSGGRSWREHAVGAERVRAISSVIGDAAPRLGELVTAVISDAVERGHLGER